MYIVYIVVVIIYQIIFPATVAVPLSVHIGMLAVVMFLSGVCFGALDNGTKAT